MPSEASPYEPLRQLLDLAERYRQPERPWRLESFLLWALSQPEAMPPPGRLRATPLRPTAPAKTEPAPTVAPGAAFGTVPGYGAASVPSEIGRLLGVIYKQMRHTSRQHMQGQAVSNMDDFGLLANLLIQPGLKKTDLIARNHLELSSGSDSIARLVRAGLIAESADRTDRRVRKLTLTDAGRAAIFEAFRQMNQLAEAMLAVLSPDEVSTLHYLLNKLYTSGPDAALDA